MIQPSDTTCSPPLSTTRPKGVSANDNGSAAQPDAQACQCGRRDGERPHGRTLLAIPVYNEQGYVTKVLDEVRHYADEILVIDDGSSDSTPQLLAQQPVDVIRHARNRGYGQSLIDAFRWAQCYQFDWVITMDCDEQHEPAALPHFYRAMNEADAARTAGDQAADVISGSRYLHLDAATVNGSPPKDRRAINARITAMVNQRLGLSITDAFCGFKAYRVPALGRLSLSERGYAFPMQFWAQAVAAGLTISEIAVSLIYNDPNRSFGGPLNDPEHRLQHYLQVFEEAMAEAGVDDKVLAGAAV